MTTELWSDNTSGSVFADAFATATTIHVTTESGTFPTPGGGQCFHIIINYGSATAEVAKVTGNSSGTFTLATGLTYSHDAGELVAAAITAEGLNSLGGGSPPTVYTKLFKTHIAFNSITTPITVDGYTPQKDDIINIPSSLLLTNIPFNGGRYPQAEFYLGSTATTAVDTLGGYLTGRTLSPRGTHAYYGTPKYSYYTVWVTEDCDGAFWKFRTGTLGTTAAQAWVQGSTKSFPVIIPPTDGQLVVTDGTHHWTFTMAGGTYATFTTFRTAFYAGTVKKTGVTQSGTTGTYLVITYATTPPFGHVFRITFHTGIATFAGHLGNTFHLHHSTGTSGGLLGFLNFSGGTTSPTNVFRGGGPGTEGTVTLIIVITRPDGF